MTLTQDRLAALSKARRVGGTPSIYLDDSELAFLLCITCRDLQIHPAPEIRCMECYSELDHYYDIPIPKVCCKHFTNDALSQAKLQAYVACVEEAKPNAFTYFLALTSLHAQRCKYRAIVEQQDIPDLETVIPRGLLEIGSMSTDKLASWLVWRKFMYDIDNRAAQTTGYLFEPILASSIGGAPASASKSPVKRDGEGKGRQVDCLLNKDAYEFKMRVTIAASGQGRFDEELSFAKDAQLSGYRPILLVLDPTPSAKLEALSAEYEKYGGEAYIGPGAWEHLEHKAGDVMSRFLQEYVREPVSALDESYDQLLPISLEYEVGDDSIIVGIGESKIKMR